MRRVGVIGCGYVGLVTGVCLADLGNFVTCIDNDKGKVESLNSGVVPIHEPGLGELLTSNMKKERLLFTHDVDSLVGCDLVMVAVGTPDKPNGEADLSQVDRAIADIMRVFDSALRPTKIVMKSTVPVGTGTRVSKKLFAKTPWISYASNPEFLREGSGVYDFTNPDRIIVGVHNPEDAGDIVDLYSQLEATSVVTDVVNAELIKYTSNAFLATKISFINEIANICEEVDADVNVVSYGMGLDPRINHHFLKAGIGYGGSCFPKDVKALRQIAGSNGYHFELLSAVIEVNDMQKYRAVNKLHQYLGELEGKKIAVFGLAFKPHTDDIRNSVAIELLNILLSKGAVITATDPLAIDKVREQLPSITYTTDPYEAVEDAEAVIIATEDPLYMDLSWDKVSLLMAGNLVIDGRNILSPEGLPSNIVLEQIGRRNKDRPTASDFKTDFGEIRKVA